MTAATPLPAALTDRLLGDAAWGVSYRVEKQAVDPSGLLTSDDIRRLLDASLLKWPYFTLLKHGEVPTVSSYTAKRDVIGHKAAGFADPRAIGRHMADGASLKLNQVGDWHRPTRDIARRLEEIRPVAAGSYVFWTPEESRGMLPHRDAAHVLVLQLEGRKEWHLYADPGQIGASAGLDVDAARPSHVFTLDAGDVLYLPHGWPHDAVARDGDSLHLTFTLTEPTPEDLVDAFLRRFLDDEHNLVHHFHTRPLPARTSEVRSALTGQARTLDGTRWADTALQTMREAIG
ncbi:cupin domain-containing protein [Streptomyces sp. NPDC054766]|uniref:cupin domain-containing protein n=1 Tax=Streptomyces rhizosphaerihabitans TaxID=1266770 RepID=UPI0021BFD8B8|nr:cupin domain-containing protein [Streptomyces rhizosphaerihabitans]MCT9011744.1 cupin domain-containing protein [Streptomyces rhizosphaerihabitans]